MGRWQPGAQGRLQRAAMELITERGYDRTTVAEIAERAGLTERTFFRHFADKREVLFAGQDLFVATIVDGVRAAPPACAPLDAAVVGFCELATVFDDDQRPRAHARQQILDAHPELQERELIKLARLAAEITAALRGRGVEDTAARLAAEAGMAVFRVAFAGWIADADGRDLAAHLHAALDDLRAVAAT